MTNKVSSFFIALLFVFSSCKNVNNNSASTKLEEMQSAETEVSVNVCEYMDSITVAPSKIENGPLPKGLKYGKVNKASYHSPQEEKALSTCDKVITSFMQYNIKEFSKYISPDMFNYYKKMAKASGYDLTIEEFVQTEFEGYNVIEILKKFRNKGFKTELVIGKLNKSIQFDQTIILVMSETTNITAPNNISFYFENFTKEIGISKDNGNTWSFLSLDERFPLFFKGIFPKKAIDAVMAELE